MEKQHNRGQDGAGVAGVKFDVPPGTPIVHRMRSASPNAMEEIFGKINHRLADVQKNKPNKAEDIEWLKKNIPYVCELFLGHVRYGTYGKNATEYCHPLLRQNNWLTKNLVIAGNFNLTNVDELFQKLIDLGQHPKEKTDTVTILEKIGHFLDRQNEKLFSEFKEAGHTNTEISSLIAKHLDLKEILHNAAKRWDGGYTIAGLLGHGDAFVLRDPNGIRPAFYYHDDEIVVATSERPALRTGFNIQTREIKELKPGHALIISKDKTVSEVEVLKPGEKKACSFERIYFSRGNDQDIYKERKNLGKIIAPTVLKSINYDLENTVFSFIPNTAEVAFLGMVEEVEHYLDKLKENELGKMEAMQSPVVNGQSSVIQHPKFNIQNFKKLLSIHPRVEKIALKDTKLRTFITNDINRNDKAAHVYDTTYGVVNRGIDTLVTVDDSIVRGTTLKQSIFRILDRLGPKKIVVVSSAPQIRYPDCYGIDMAKLGDLVAFEAAVALLKESFRENLLDEIYEKAKVMNELPREKAVNLVKQIYDLFTPDQITHKITQLLTPDDIKAEVEIIYQSIEGLHEAIPHHKGDWYFTGNYPTPGGNKVVNRSFINYMEGKNVRAY